MAAAVVVPRTHVLVAVWEAEAWAAVVAAVVVEVVVVAVAVADDGGGVAETAVPAAWVAGLCPSAFSGMPTKTSFGSCYGQRSAGFDRVAADGWGWAAVSPSSGGDGDGGGDGVTLVCVVLVRVEPLYINHYIILKYYYNTYIIGIKSLVIIRTMHYINPHSIILLHFIRGGACILLRKN